MNENTRFLKTSSAILKVAAWIFLFFGLSGGLSVFLGRMPEFPRWAGIVLAGIYSFVFFVLYVIVRLVELLLEIINKSEE